MWKLSKKSSPEMKSTATYKYFALAVPAGLTPDERKVLPLLWKSSGVRDLRLSVDIPADLHQAVKVAVAQRGTSMRAASIEALTWWLKDEQK